jgi:serine acetyltransferase
VIVAPGATVVSDAGTALTVTVSGNCVVADELETDVTVQAATARSVGTRSSAIRPALRWEELELAGFPISPLPKKAT